MINFLLRDRKLYLQLAVTIFQVRCQNNEETCQNYRTNRYKDFGTKRTLPSDSSGNNGIIQVCAPCVYACTLYNIMSVCVCLFFFFLFLCYMYIFFYFRSYGELKAVRLPKKLVGTGRHRGFVFIEYHTKTDAKVIHISIHYM